MTTLRKPTSTPVRSVSKSALLRRTRDRALENIQEADFITATCGFAALCTKRLSLVGKILVDMYLRHAILDGVYFLMWYCAMVVVRNNHEVPEGLWP